MNGLLPLADFPAEMRAEIDRLAAAPRPPSKWIRVQGAHIPSRAWAEWHLRRGLTADGEREALPDEIRELVIQRDGMHCGICDEGIGDRSEIHIDHLVPVALGGTNALSNLQVSHALCNMRKGARADVADVRS